MADRRSPLICADAEIEVRAALLREEAVADWQ
jgi:hypothetical protein